MPTPAAFPCPSCATLLEPGVTSCSSCGLRLVGPEATRLWQVNQQITALRLEADHLVEVLGRPPGAVAAPAPYAVGPYPVQRTAPPAPVRTALSGQQVLLGLGALLLLSAASFFLLVVWFVVGLVGQALIMAALTASAVGGSVLATRRRLPAAAETAAVIATGLLVLDLAAAHWLNLAGLGDLPGDAYWAGAGLLGGALLLGFDRVVPRVSGGEALRRVLVYRPAATTMLAVAGWSLVSALDPDEVVLSGLALVLAAASGGLAGAAYRLDVHAPALRMPWSALPALVSAALALTTHVLVGLGLGYDPASSALERYAACALLLVVPGVALVAHRRAARTHELVPVVVLAWLVPVVAIPLLDAHRLLVVALSVALAAVLTIAAAGHRLLPQRPWATALAGVAWAAQPLLFVLVLSLAEEGVTTGRLLLDGVTSPERADWWVPVVPALGWAVTSLVAALRTRSALWVAAAETAVLVTVFTALRESEAMVWWPVALVMVAGNLALAGLGARRGHTWLPVEGVAVGFAAAWSITAIVAGAWETSFELAVVLVVVGVLTLLYAATPGRLLVSYVGALSISIGLGVLTWEADVATLEVYTAPLALLLAAIGAVQWSRDHSLPTFLTMGPALTVALVPTLLVAVAEGSALRLLLVTVAGVVVLVAGLARHWQAPVTVGGVVLVVVALTQGGPLMAYVPGWIILGLAGAVLLAAGVAWERAVVAGRRASAWYGSLR